MNDRIFRIVTIALLLIIIGLILTWMSSQDTQQTIQQPINTQPPARPDSEPVVTEV